MTSPSFAVRKDKLGDDDHWRQRRSDTSTYRIEDFDFKQPVHVSPTNQTRPFWPNFWRPVSMGVIALVAASVALAFAGRAFLPIQFGSLNFEASLGSVVVAFIALAYVVYAGILYGVTPDSEINAPVFDEWRYVVPGWQPCHFTFGTEGIGVDGTHFVYFFEWADLYEIIEKPNRFVLRNYNEHVLTIPSHFFDNGNGGDISWRQVKELIDQRKPPGAHWA